MYSAARRPNTLNREVFTHYALKAMIYSIMHIKKAEVNKTYKKLTPKKLFLI